MSRFSTIDHGETLAHDMSGKPLHYVHEISVRRDGPFSSRTVLDRIGYKYSRGWRDAEGNPWDTYTRTRGA